MAVQGKIRSVPLGIVLRREKSNEVDGGQRLKTCEAVGRVHVWERRSCLGNHGTTPGVTVLHQESRYLKWQRGKGSAR